MARGMPVREIPRLRSSGLSATVMARAQPVSKTSAADTLHAADERGVAWEDVEGMPDAEACAPLFPERVHEGPVYRDPDRDRAHRELARVGVTLRRLHEEHRDDARSKGEPFMSYDRFCKRYREFTVRKQVVGRVGHKAGRIMGVGWAGPTMRPVEPATGEVSKVYLFVAFQAPALDERLPDGPDELFRGFLLEPMEARYGTASTVFCTQFRQKDRHARLGGGVHADAIMDRIVHGAAWVGMGEMSMRRKLGPVPNRACAPPVSIEDAGGIMSRYRRYQIAISDGIKRSKYSSAQQPSSRHDCL